MLLLIVSILSFITIHTFFLFQAQIVCRKPFAAARPSRPLQFVRKKWESVHFIELNSNVYVLSSFIDKRNGNLGYPFVRVLTLSRSNRKSKLYCIFSDNSTSSAKEYEFCENHDMPFGAFIYSCLIPSSIDPDQVHEVSVSDSSKTITIKPTYQVEVNTFNYLYSVNYAICLPMLYGEFYSANAIVEFVEMNRLIGVKSITFYIGATPLRMDVRRILHYYQNDGIVNVINFQLPLHADKIWYKGQMLTINDCLYRHIGFAKYVAFHDLDEVIIPEHQLQLPEMCSRVFKDNVATMRIPARFVYQSAKFGLSKMGINISQSFEMKRTKCIVRPEFVFEQGIHHTSRVIQDHFVIVPPEQSKQHAVVYHFRTHQSNKAIAVEDILEKRYGKQLKTAIQEVLMANSLMPSNSKT